MSSLADRIRMILTENELTQAHVAADLGVSPNYINFLANGKKDKISDILAKLIEEVYGYSATWIMTGEGEKAAANNLSYRKLATIKKVKNMTEEEANAVLAFIHSYDELEKLYGKE